MKTLDRLYQLDGALEFIKQRLLTTAMRRDPEWTFRNERVPCCDTYGTNRNESFG